MSKPVNPLRISLLTAQVTTLAASTHASVVLAALPEGESKGAWNKLVPAGTFTARDGRGPFHAGGRSEMEAILARTLKYAGGTELMIDYDHQSFLSAVKGVGGRAPAAGWIKELEVREDGIWGLIEWTLAASEAIKAGEYRYLSPSFSNDKAGNIHTIFNAGLLNMPATDLVAIAAGVDHSTLTEPDMKNIAKALGLEETASEDAILAAINKLTTDRSRVVTTAGLKPEATTDELVTTLSAALAAKTPDPAKFVPIEQVTALQTEVTNLKAEIVGDKATTAVDKAIEDGKLLPALRDWGLQLFKSDHAQFTAFIDKAPSLTTTQLGSKKTTASTDADGLTEADERVIQLMGVSREDFIKSRKAEQAAA